MNYQRRVMEATLPETSQYLCRHLWKKLHEAGISNIPAQDIEFIGRLVSDYFRNTAEGKITALKLLNAQVAGADYRNAYFPDGKAHDAANRIPHEDLMEYRGWIYKGSHSIPYNSVDVDQNGNLEACESTGILGPRDYCVKVVKVRGSGGRESLQSMSNYARLLSEDVDVRDTASMSKCERCFVKDCAYYPHKEPQQLSLRAVGV